MGTGELPKVLVTDLDGTIVRGDETVSPRTHAALRRAIDHGITVIGATGRGPRLLNWTVSDHIPMADHLIMAQGAFVYDTTDSHNPRRLSSQLIDGEILYEQVQRIESHIDKVYMMAESDDPDTPLSGDDMPVWPWDLSTVVRDRRAALTGPMVKLYFWPDSLDSDTVLEKAEPLLADTEVGITESGVGMLELSPAGMDKWRGIEAVLKERQVGWHEVLAFGDALNDLGMLSRAGRSVAMPQGHQRILDAADEIAPADNDGDGVARYLERLLDGRS
ncbi:HAD hydrolase family protein [Haloglycomyces albus]|uniref:HAD hydrolase family protein n=1 Tax=Haloglycomyces albus TaxID=526067 RepID=UPI00046D8F47|nr:HAD hydrolase family protein [Haloglycomyces albus]